MEDPTEVKEQIVELADVNLANNMLVLELEGVVVDAIPKKRGDVSKGVTRERQQELIKDACPSDRNIKYIEHHDVDYIEKAGVLYYIRPEANRMLLRLQERCKIGVFSCLPEAHINAIIAKCFIGVDIEFVWGRSRTHMQTIEDRVFLVKDISDVLDNVDINAEREWNFDNVLMVGCIEQQCATARNNILILSQKRDGERSAVETQIRQRLNTPPRVGSCIIV